MSYLISGDELRGRRKRLGISQAALGERAGVPQPLVSLLESQWATSAVGEALLHAELEALELEREQEQADAAAPTDEAATAA